MQCPSCNQACNRLDVEDFGMCNRCNDAMLNQEADWDNDAFATHIDEQPEHDDMFSDDLETEYDDMYDNSGAFSEVEQGFYDDDSSPWG